MRLLVIGANGLLGSNVVHAAQERDWDVSGTYHSTRPAFDVPLSQFDLESFDAFKHVLDGHDLDVVVNCAAMTDVDGCENAPEQAHTLNGDAPGRLAEQCKIRDIEFGHVSTDYVFDGEEERAYSESAATNPVQVYGASKLAGEQAVRSVLQNSLITRLSFVWGIHRGTDELTGFPAWVLDQLQAGDDIPLFTDQWVTPTRAGQAAETILDLMEQDASGLFNVACRSCVTPYEFGEVLAEQAGASETLLSQGSMADVERAATRPTHSCLDVDKVESVLDREQPTLREDVRAVSHVFR